jgi:hypothetical protein
MIDFYILNYFIAVSVFYGNKNFWKNNLNISNRDSFNRCFFEIIFFFNFIK